MCLRSMNPWSTHPSQAGVPALGHLPSTPGKGAPRDTHGDHWPPHMAISSPGWQPCPSSWSASAAPSAWWLFLLPGHIDTRRWQLASDSKSLLLCSQAEISLWGPRRPNLQSSEIRVEEAQMPQVGPWSYSNKSLGPRSLYSFYWGWSTR